MREQADDGNLDAGERPVDPSSVRQRGQPSRGRGHKRRRWEDEGGGRDDGGRQPSESPAGERDDLHDGRAGQRFRKRQGVGEVAVGDPAAGLDEVPTQKAQGRAETTERYGTQPQENPRHLAQGRPVWSNVVDFRGRLEF
jgi:hypothetical protein